MFDGILFDDDFVARISGEITQTLLHELFVYDSGTGVFTNRVNRAHRAKKGDVAGCVHKPSGYRILHIAGKPRKAHVLAYLYMTGRLPDRQLDHIDGNRSNNRWANLRLATQSQNLGNSDQYQRGVSGIRGVYPIGRKWFARINLNYQKIYLGCFDTKEAAEFVYLQARERYWGEFNHATFRKRLAEIAPIELEL